MTDEKRLPFDFDDFHIFLTRSYGTLFTKHIFQIFWLSNILTMTVPEEGYSRNVLCALN